MNLTQPSQQSRARQLSKARRPGHKPTLVGGPRHPKRSRCALLGVAHSRLPVSELLGGHLGTLQGREHLALVKRSGAACIDLTVNADRRQGQRANFHPTLDGADHLPASRTHAGVEAPRPVDLGRVAAPIEAGHLVVCLVGWCVVGWTVRVEPVHLEMCSFDAGPVCRTAANIDYLGFGHFFPVTGEVNKPLTSLILLESLGVWGVCAASEFASWDVCCDGDHFVFLLPLIPGSTGCNLFRLHGFSIAQFELVTRDIYTVRRKVTLSHNTRLTVTFKLSSEHPCMP